MSIKLGVNIPSLKAQAGLKKASEKLSVSMQRLSSGLRINSPSDDPAGQAVAVGLKSDSNVFRQGIRNVNDSISLLNIAASSVTELGSILTRIQELAQQASNGAYTSSQREAMDYEAQALREEYNRIVTSTSFNDKELLDGSFGTNYAQAGYGAANAIEYDIGLSTQEAQGTGEYTNGGIYSPISAFAGHVKVGDVNNDGINDIVTASGGYSDEMVLLGNGNGTFKAPITNSGINSNYDIELADVNGDGNLDLLGADITTGYLEVAFGAGNGTFGTVVTYLAGSTNLELTVGDFNEDGNKDVAIVSQGDDTMRILLGNANGTFNAPTSYTSGDQNPAMRGDIQVGDFNGDGNQDLVVTSTNIGQFDIYLGTGTGTFGARVSTLTHGFAAYEGLGVGDFNNDGKDDVVSYKGVYLSTTGGATSLSHNFTSLGLDGMSVVADLNGDGNLDLVRGGANPLALLGNGDGTFSLGATFSPGSAIYPTQLAVGDFTEDQVPDIVFSMTAVGQRVYLQGATISQTVELGEFDVLTQSAALSTLTYISTVQDSLTEERGNIGAYLSRMEIAVSNLQSLQSNTLEAASRITEVNVAEETAELVKAKIHQKAATALLAQANQIPKIALKLLQ